MLRGEPLHLAICILSHLTPHPDIMWNSQNWIPEEVRKEANPHLVWDPKEIWTLLSCTAWEAWQRGDSGEDLYMLFMEDPEIQTKMESIAVAAMNAGDEVVAFSALYLTIYWARDRGAEKYQQMIEKCPEFRTLPLAAEMEQSLQEDGYVILFE